MRRLQPKKFNAWLNNIGQVFAWQHSAACPCYQEHSGAPDPNCGLCGGRGRIWDAAVEGKSGIAGQKIQRQWAEFGQWEAGDVVLTIPSDSPLYAMGEFDRAVMVNSSQPFSVNRRRGQHDKLTFPVVQIDRVFWKSPDDEIVEGGIPVVAADGSLSWPEGGEPPAGMQFSITGRRRPEYFCFGEFPQDRAHHSGADLPRRVVLRRWDLFGRYGNT